MEGKKRRVRLDESFFTGYRRTILEPSEVLVNILVPFTEKVKLQYMHIFREGKGPRPVLRIQRGGVETWMWSMVRGAGL